MNTKAATTNAARRPRFGDENIIRTSHPSGKVQKNFALYRPTRIAPDYVSASLGNKSGYQTYQLAVGQTTYRAITFAVVSTVAIAGKTQVIGGKHFVLLSALAEFIEEVRIVANGTDLQRLSCSELMRRNTYHAQTLGPAFTGFHFPGENMYHNRMLMDAYALGTLGFRSLSFEAKLSPVFDNNTMEVVCVPHVVDYPKQVGFTYTTERINKTFSGAGKHTYKDIPVADDIKDIWIQGDGITHLKFEVDGDIMFDMDRATYESYLTSNGKDISSLNGNWMIDFHAEGDPRSLAALDRVGEVRRGANIKLDITTTQGETPVEFLITNAGLYRNIR
jgi:hypothetical protein